MRESCLFVYAKSVDAVYVSCNLDFRCTMVTSQLLMLYSPAVQVNGHHDEQGCDPNDAADDSRDEWCPVATRFDGVAHGQVSVGTHHNQREH